MLLETGQARWDTLSEADRDRLVRHYAQKVKIVALRLKNKLPQHIELGELLSAGTLGLMETLGKFDPDLGIKFETYAENRIRGAMLDELRRMDWFSRGLRQRVRTLEEAILKAEKTTGESPTSEQLQEATGLSFSEVERGLEALQNQVCLSLELVEEKINSTRREIGSEPFQTTIHQEMIDLVAKLVDELTPREQMVMSLYYTDELNMRETAEVMDITEGRVSQLHSQALAKLRSKLRNQLSGDDL